MLVLKLFNGARTKEAWDENSPHFIDDWKPEERDIYCSSVQITYGTHIKVTLTDMSLLELFWDDFDVVAYDGCFFGDLSIETVYPTG